MADTSRPTIVLDAKSGNTTTLPIGSMVSYLKCSARRIQGVSEWKPRNSFPTCSQMRNLQRLTKYRLYIPGIYIAENRWSNLWWENLMRLGPLAYRRSSQPNPTRSELFSLGTTTFISVFGICSHIYKYYSVINHYPISISLNRLHLSSNEKILCFELFCDEIP